MAQESYRVLTFSILANLTQFGDAGFVPGMSSSDGPVAGIEYTIPAGVHVFCRHGQTGDLYQVFDGEVRSHISKLPNGCLEGETAGFCYGTDATSANGLVTMRVTYGNYFGTGAEAVRP